MLRKRPLIHPILKDIIVSEELGIIKKIEANLTVRSDYAKDNTICMVYDLGGGAMVDMGCEFYFMVQSSHASHDFIPHRLHFVSRYLSGADPVVSAKSDVLPKFSQIDTTTTATLAFPTPEGSAETGSADGLTATLNANFRLPSTAAKHNRTYYRDAWNR